MQLQDLHLEREKLISRERLLIKNTNTQKVLTAHPKSMTNLTIPFRLQPSSFSTPKVNTFQELQSRNSSYGNSYFQQKSHSVSRLPYLQMDMQKSHSQNFLTPSARNRSQTKHTESNLYTFETTITPKSRTVKKLYAINKSPKSPDSPLLSIHRPKIVLENIKKYDVTTPKAKYKVEKVRKNYVSNLQSIIDNHLKPRRPRKSGTVSPPRRLVNIDEVNLDERKGSRFTKDEEVQILSLRKKILISRIFDSIESPDEKKEKYKELIIEYHPDKGNYDKGCCEEIFRFLVANKPLFLCPKKPDILS